MMTMMSPSSPSCPFGGLPDDNAAAKRGRRATADLGKKMSSVQRSSFLKQKALVQDLRLKKACEIFPRLSPGLPLLRGRGVKPNLILNPLLTETALFHHHHFPPHPAADHFSPPPPLRCRPPCPSGEPSSSVLARSSGRRRPLSQRPRLKRGKNPRGGGGNGSGNSVSAGACPKRPPPPPRPSPPRARASPSNVPFFGCAKSHSIVCGPCGSQDAIEGGTSLSSSLRF